MVIGLRRKKTEENNSEVERIASLYAAELGTQSAKEVVSLQMIF